MLTPRLVVTEVDADGTSRLAREGEVESVAVGAAPGVEFYPVWGTEGQPVVVGTAAPGPVTRPFFPGVGGTRVLFARYQPAGGVVDRDESPDVLRAEADALLPGLMDPFEPGDTSGMHATDTLDYAILLEGELTMDLEDGSAVPLQPGTCVIQRGTRHAWRNEGSQPALMVFVGVGGVRAG